MTVAQEVGDGPLWEPARGKLGRLAAAGLLRSPSDAGGPADVVYLDGGRELANFSSNNYLGFANHPAVRAAAAEAAARWGTGAGGSRLTTGSLRLHRELEIALARLKGAEDALVFSSGYTANLGLVGALVNAGERRAPVFFDRLAHASLVDAAVLSGARWRSFRHNDPEALDTMLTRLPRSEGGEGGFRAVVLTEGVFSMDGDLAPLAELLAVCERHDALLVVDDAHGTGTVGPQGRGAAALAGVGDAPHLVHVGTLSKALGSQGGFVAGPASLRDLLVSTSRPFIFDTALAPPCVGAAHQAVRMLEEGDARVRHLRENAAHLRSRLAAFGIETVPSPAPIVPVVIGDEAKTMRIARALRDAGFLTVGIRPPSVPKGESRLRLTVMADHRGEQIEALAGALAASLAVG